MPKFNVMQCTDEELAKAEKDEDYAPIPVKVGEIRAVSLTAAHHIVKVGIRKGTYEQCATVEQVAEKETLIFDTAALEIGTPLGWAGD